MKWCNLLSIYINSNLVLVDLQYDHLVAQVQQQVGPPSRAAARYGSVGDPAETREAGLHVVDNVAFLGLVVARDRLVREKGHVAPHAVAKVFILNKRVTPLTMARWMFHVDHRVRLVLLAVQTLCLARGVEGWSLFARGLQARFVFLHTRFAAHDGRWFTRATHLNERGVRLLWNNNHLDVGVESSWVALVIKLWYKVYSTPSFKG